MWIWTLVAIACASPPPMVAHHADASAVRDALIDGDLELARKHAKKIEKRSFGDVEPALGSHVDAVTTSAGAIVAARDVSSAAEQLGRLGAACGACHGGAGGGPDAPNTEAPPVVDTVTGEMQRHRWAATSMWDALVRGDDTGFKSAAEIMAQAPLTPSGTPVDSSLTPLATELEVKAHDEALLAARATEPTKRADHYGRMLSACHACHAVVRR